MFAEHHDLTNEFPEYKQVIHDLKTNDAHFARLFDEYHEADKEVRHMEEEIETPADHVVEDAKKRRLMLLDQLSTILHKHEPATA